MTNQEDKDKFSAQANDSSIAIGKLEIGGDVSGNITIGNTGFSAKEVSVLITQITATFQPKPFDGRCPYKGLDVFEEEDAELFFGREKLVDDLVSRVKDTRTVFVTGPSGSGKSSLVRAGLIHALKQGAIKGSERWLYVTMKPGRDPIGELGRVIASLTGTANAEDEIRAKAMKDATIFTRWCEIALKEGRDKRFVLFIDQFEEVFTQINNETERVSFLNLLTHAATVENGRVIILFSMRSDFVSNCATYPQLNELLSKQFRQIGAMQPEELVSAIAQPALRVGLRIDPDLIAQIINDMKSEPGVLPLMQFALKDLFDAVQARGGMLQLTLDDYLRRGGIQKSLERHADAAFSALGTHEQELARSIFSGLIEIGRGTQDTKRTALFNELIPAEAQAEEVQAIIRKLADARLITTDVSAGRDTVTISHEKLIDAWPWLKKLVDENRDIIALKNEIANDANEWEDRKRESSYLYSGARLANAREQLDTKKLLLSGLAQEFVKAGRTRQQRSQFVLIAGITAIIVLLAMAVIVFSNQSNENAHLAGTAQAANTLAIAQQSTAQAASTMAIAQQSTAVANSQIALARQLAAQSELNIDLYPQRATLLGIMALKASNPYLLTAPEQALRDAIANIHGIPLPGTDYFLQSAVFSPDGKWLVTAYIDSRLRFWDLQNPSSHPAHELYLQSVPLSTLAMSADGHWLAVGGYNSVSTTFGGAYLVDMQNIQADPIQLQGDLGRITGLHFSNDGKWLASNGYLWSMQNLSGKPTILHGFEGGLFGGGADDLAFSPDNKWLAVSSIGANVTRIWDLNELSKDPIVKTGYNGKVAFSKDGRWMAAKGIQNTLGLWKTDDLAADPTILQGPSDYVNALMFPNNNYQLVAGAGNTIWVWDLYQLDKLPVQLKGLVGANSGLDITPDGKWLAASANGNTKVEIWNLSRPGDNPLVLLGHEDAVTNVVFSPDQKWLVTGGFDKNSRLWSLAQFEGDPAIFLGLGQNSLGLGPFNFLFNSTGKTIAIDRNGKNIEIWQDKNWPDDFQLVQTLDTRFRPIGFSPDGTRIAYEGQSGIQIINLNTPSDKPKMLEQETGKTGVQEIIFSKARWAAAQYYGSTFQLWDLNSPDLKPQIIGGPDDVLSIALSPDERFFAASRRWGEIYVWGLDNIQAGPKKLVVPKDIAVDSGYISKVAFTPDGHWLVVGSERNLLLWDLGNVSKPPYQLDQGYFKSDIVFNSEGDLMAIGSSDKSSQYIHIWNLKNLSEPPVILRGHTSLVMHMAFSHDGNWLASGDSGAILRWNLHDPTVEPLRFRYTGSAVTFLLFDQHDEWLEAGSTDGIWLWRMDTDHLIEKACQMAGRNLMHAEWSQYFPGEEYRITCPQWPVEPEVTLTPSVTP